ncbi:MAG: glycosyltransferase family 2 protein [Taibaiella sp.]|nr:glycosyltransferase family 2 protein [Taibaiella sp.]
MQIIYWLSLLIVFYAFAGYGLLLYIIIKVRRAVQGRPKLPGMENLPPVTLVIAAYNEADIMEAKIQNTLALQYPANKLHFLFTTDGSNDNSPEIIAKYPQIKMLHSPERRGKMHAMHRAMSQVHTEVVVFTDANTFLNNEAIINIARHYSDKKVGAVSGEKRVLVSDVSDATAGEGFYWKYESALKKWDSELYSVMGAAGELFSVRRELYEAVPADTILDDFMISMLIVQKGYRIVYEPDAYATESSSANVKEELKRKVRIAAGGIQSILRLKKLLNPFAYPVVSFQYISHRVLRWTVTPFLMILAFLLNIVLAIQFQSMVYSVFLVSQILFYGMALLGWIMDQRKIKVKIFFIPYYFCVMNYAVVAGIYRYLFKEQSAVWEKAKRKSA